MDKIDSRRILDELARMRDEQGRAAHGGRGLNEAQYDFPAETIEELADALNYWNEHLARRISDPFAGKLELTAIIAAREYIYMAHEFLMGALMLQREGK